MPDVSTGPEAALRLGWFERLLNETRFLRKYPQYAGVLSRMDPIATNTVDTMAVGLRRWDGGVSRVMLLVNTEYFDANPEYRAGILLHEIQHVLLGHISNATFHAVRYPRLMELAMEISADEFIGEALPINGLEMHNFSRFGIESRQSTFERYACLAAAYDSGELKMSDYAQSRMRDTHRPRQGGAKAIGLGDLIDGRSDGASERNWKRNAGFQLGWPTGEDMLSRMRRTIAVHLRGPRGGRDDLVEGTQRRVAKELKRVVLHGAPAPRVDWRRAIREAFPPARVVHPDYKRPNRRFVARVGEVPGRSRRTPKPRLLVAVDTSGSMSGVQLDRIAQELRRVAVFARIDIAECDAAVHRVYPIGGDLRSFIGGGDTDFGPVFDEVGERYDGVIYFTDGKGDMPIVAPHVRVLWALTNDDPFHAEFGAVLRLP